MTSTKRHLKMLINRRAMKKIMSISLKRNSNRMKEADQLRVPQTDIEGSPHKISRFLFSRGERKVQGFLKNTKNLVNQKNKTALRKAVRDLSRRMMMRRNGAERKIMNFVYLKKREKMPSAIINKQSKALKGLLQENILEVKRSSIYQSHLKSLMLITIAAKKWLGIQERLIPLIDTVMHHSLEVEGKRQSKRQGKRIQMLLNSLSKSDWSIKETKTWTISFLCLKQA